jgi:P4 family phage/plasmid primase-like protien
MTDRDILKFKMKAQRELYLFMDVHRYSEENNEKPTHLSYGLFSGKFVLNKENRKQFMNLYMNAINNGVSELSILEIQNEYSSILVDIDLKISMDLYDKDYNKGRLYNNKLILNIAEKYVNAINYYLKIDKDDFKFAILEKNKMSEKDGEYKDGFHIMFFNVIASVKIRHLIRHKVVEMCNQENTFSYFQIPSDKIIDKAVVHTNAWFLYGSKKPNANLYILSSIYNYNITKYYDHKKHMLYENNSLNYEKYTYSDDDLIKLLSIQGSKTNKNNANKLREIEESDIDAECEQLGIISTIKSENPDNFKSSTNKDDEIRKASKFTMLLSNTRADDYFDWLRVGLAIHSIGSHLLDIWIDFSKKCPKKYKENECVKVWKTFKDPIHGNMLTIRSLAYWAKIDNPKEYEEFIKSEFNNVMKKSLNGNTYYLAKSFYAKYCDRFVCSSSKNNIWWEFTEHRWKKIEDGCTIKLLFSEDFANEYNKKLIEISSTFKKVDDQGKELLQKQREILHSLISKLMDITFKKKLLEECKNFFLDDKFEQKLDSNIYLIGFENGIYDLETAIFREGRPDDYITLSTNHDYINWTKNNIVNKLLFSFFDQVLPNKIVQKYFLHVLCTCLTGDTKEEKIYILNGCGSNGKSLTMDLMYLAFGDYYMSCPITIITRKRGQSNETSPEKVRMKGRRCGVFQEPDEGEKLNVGIMKEFTGGDKILVRDLYKSSNEMIEFKPQMKYFLTCNQLPVVPSNDDGTWRRLRVIDFVSKFTDTPNSDNKHEFLIDNTLKQKIKNWGSTFISYLIYIYNTEYKHLLYLTDPPEVLASTKQYKMENDPFTDYITNRIEFTNNIKNTILVTALHDDFKLWYKTEYPTLGLPKKTDIPKFFTKLLGEPNKQNYYCKIIMKTIIKETSNLDENPE